MTTLSDTNSSTPKNSKIYIPGNTPTPKKFAQQLEKAYEEINLKLKTLTNQVSHFGHKEGQILMEMIRNQKEALAFLSKQFDEYLPNYYVETNKYKIKLCT